jgi:hypothetical protein
MYNMAIAMATAVCHKLKTTIDIMSAMRISVDIVQYGLLTASFNNPQFKK